MKHHLSHKSLLIYGYALPIFGALLVAVCPLAVFGLNSYLKVVSVFQNSIALAMSVIALSAAVSIPFQVKVFAEDSDIVLYILKDTQVRKVFMDALHYQAFTIVILGVILITASTLFPAAYWVGFLLLFCASLVGFETLSMISNGRAYANLRENILTKTAEANSFIKQSARTNGARDA